MQGEKMQEEAMQVKEMDRVRVLIDSYLAAWNERQPERRRELVGQVFSDDAHYRDPLMQGEGQDGIDAMIAAAQAQFPGHTFRLVGNVDGYGEYARFSWALDAPHASQTIRGSDFAVLHEGRLREVTGFLDALSAPAEAR